MKNRHIESGRKTQKLKTRSRILKAANRLIESGKQVTLDDIAKEANISRATIYRYYSNVDSLSTELVLQLNVPDSDEVLRKISSGSLIDSLLEIQKIYLNFILENEKASRKFLGATLSTTDSKLERGQNRLTVLRKFFENIKEDIDPKLQSKLINLMVLFMGIESIISTKDVSGLDNDQSMETLRWGLEMILKGCGLDQHPQIN
ncbi:TetR/AcrR family transcriptional regulator [Flagellimonas sp.]|uniref:TetR/AcrR family transcriptional regulator n=1 Tax=Flagellimonas sp. TaxID=2058762 RepID=UPI003B50CBB0